MYSGVPPETNATADPLFIPVVASTVLITIKISVGSEMESKTCVLQLLLSVIVAE